LFPRKYFKYGNLLSSPLALGSWIWNGIKSTVPLLSFGACFIPYNASRLPIWSSPWIPTILNFMPMHPLMISDLFSSGFTSFDDFRSHPCTTVSWMPHLLHFLFHLDSLRNFENVYQK